jgi:hypothetical protein
VTTTGSDTYIGLDNYLFCEGLAYRLLPIRSVSHDGQTGEVHTEAMYDHVMNKFAWGNMEDPDVNIDDNNARMIMNLRSMMGRLATALILEGKADSARKVLDLAMEKMPETAVPFDYFSVPVAEGYIRIGESEKGRAILEKIFITKTAELGYFFSFPVKDQRDMDVPIQEALITLNLISETAKRNQIDDLSKKAGDELGRYYDLYVKNVYSP